MTGAGRPDLIIGIAGQDGRLLARRLRALGRPLQGWIRPGSAAAVPDADRLDAVDLTDAAAVAGALAALRPARVFYLAAVHHSAEARPDDRFASRAAMRAVNFTGVVHVVEGLLRGAPDARLVFAASSQMYAADAGDLVVDERTPVRPRTYYGVTKAWSVAALEAARRQDGLHAASAILFNHESPLRPPAFVTRKITRAAAEFALGRRTAPLALANLGARADWSSAADIVDGLVGMADAGEPADMVLGSGVLRPLTALLDAAFDGVGLDWRAHVTADRDAAEATVRADPRRAADRLGWRARTGFDDWVRAMVEADRAALSGDRTGSGSGGS